MPTTRWTPDPASEELRATVRAFLDRHLPAATVLDLLRAGVSWDPDLWRRLAAELGTVGLDVPEERGGAGAGIRELAVVAEELGRVPVRLPWFSTAVLGVGTLLGCRGGAALLPRLLDGSSTATLAVQEDPAGVDLDAIATTAEPDGAGWRLTGTKDLVVEGATADLLLVVARAADGLGVFAVRGDADGLTRRALDALDPTRELARLAFDRSPAERIDEPRTATATVSRVLDRAVVLLAAEQLGGAAGALDAAVAHVRQRRQFGRPIGSFQAVKHRCADMAVEVEAARSAVAWAVACADGDDSTRGADDGREPGGFAAAVAVAGLTCGAAYRSVAAENIQVHGGMGFTWEHPAHLHLRRATTGAVLLGDRRAHTERLLGAVGV